ncbi:MAG: hypothetical protein M1816_006743 [Peltula sp. TS41687]|nr:MAG: hypothetical protein M1816_006743 [Peltula sp. TS41687]
MTTSSLALAFFFLATTFATAIPAAVSSSDSLSVASSRSMREINGDRLIRSDPQIYEITHYDVPPPDMPAFLWNRTDPNAYGTEEPDLSKEVTGYMVLRVTFTTQGANNLAFSVNVPTDASTGPITMTQVQCRKGFQDAVDWAITQSQCQGYTGRHTGDGMGNFYSASSGAGGANGPVLNVPTFSFWVERPGYTQTGP